MSSLQAPIREIVVDFAGTLARPTARLAAHDVVRALHHAYQWTSPADFTAALGRVIKQARTRDQQTSRQTAFADLLTAAADACGTHLPESADAVQAALFATLPDAHIDPDAAGAVRELAARGYRLILADNTRRTLAAREHTLHHAGILDCFDRVLLSNESGPANRITVFTYQCCARASTRPSGCCSSETTPPTRRRTTPGVGHARRPGRPGLETAKPAGNPTAGIRRTAPLA